MLYIIYKINLEIELFPLMFDVSSYSPIEMEEVYDVLLNDWLIKAGDGYEMIKDNIIEHIELSMCDS